MELVIINIDGGVDLPPFEDLVTFLYLNLLNIVIPLSDLYFSYERI